MSSSPRHQEQRDDASPSGLRWFELYENLAAFGSASAYPMSYSTALGRWLRDTSSPRRTIYSLVDGVTGSTGEFVSCYLNPVTRKWEVIKPRTTGAPQSLYYYLYKNVKGFASDIGGFGTLIMDATKTVAWPGAAFLVGDETEVGIEFDAAEADPDTNGNFLITKTGVFRVDFTHYYRVRLGNTGSSTFNEILVKCDLYRKPILGGGNALLADSLTGTPIRHFDNFEYAETGSVLYKNFMGMGHFFATIGDRLSFRLQISSDTAIPANFALAWNFPLVHFTYLQAADMLADSQTF